MTAKPQKEEPQKAPKTVEEVVTGLAEEFDKRFEQMQGQISTLTQAIVKVNEKVEAKAASGEGGGANEVLRTIRELAGEGNKSKGFSLDEFKKQARAFAELADTLQHFRRPSPIGPAELYLMRVGVRAGGRYMPKHELDSWMKVLGGEGEKEGEGETEHVKSE